MVSQIKDFTVNFLVSGSAAVVSKTLIAPVERSKFILQNQESALQVLIGERERYKGLIDVLRRIPKEQGTLSFWRGNGTNLIRYFPSQALNFSLYEYYKQLFCSGVTKRLVLCEMAAGALAGACSTCVVFPLDFCQTRLTVDVGSGQVFYRSKICRPVAREFTGLLHCVQTVYGKDGVAGLYYGLHMSILGVALYRGIYFGLYDYGKHAYNIYRGDHVKMPVLLSFLMAQFVTVFSGFVVYPLDTVSRRMMLDSGRSIHLRKYPSASQTFKIMYLEEGILGFYKGAFTNMIRCTAGALVLVFYNEVMYYANLKKI